MAAGRVGVRPPEPPVIRGLLHAVVYLLLTLGFGAWLWGAV